MILEYFTNFEDIKEFTTRKKSALITAVGFVCLLQAFFEQQQIGAGNFIQGFGINVLWKLLSRPFSSSEKKITSKIH